MKKQGFTLAEVMVTLGIIGVLAAIMLPLANKFKPDATKATYLKTYDSLVQTINAVTTDETIYPTVSNNRNFSNRPLFNTGAVSIDGTDIASGANKLCRVLSYAFQDGINEGACSNNYISADKDFTPDFTAKNGVQFMVGRVNGDYYRTDIYIDVDNNEESRDCLYDADNCPNPDRFKFYVGVDGNIVPGDPMGANYLATRTNMKVQKDVEIDGTEIDFPENMKTEAAKFTLRDRLSETTLIADKISNFEKLTDFELSDRIQNLINSGEIKWQTDGFTFVKGTN